MSDKSLIFKLINKSDVKKLGELLKKNKILIYEKGHNLQYPIHDACFIGNIKVIEKILEHDNKNLNLINESGKTGYQILAKYNPNLLIYFIKKYTPMNIHWRNRYGHDIIVTYIINNDLDPKIMIELKKAGCSLIKIVPDNNYYSINSEDINNLAYILLKDYKLLDKVKKYFKFDVNKLHYNKPLSFLALNNDNLDMLKMLVKHKINLNLNDKKMDDLLSLSILQKKYKFIDYLMENLKDFSFIDSYENSYFSLIILNELDEKYHRFFLEKVEDLNKKDILGNTTIHIIFQYNLYDKLKDLIINKKVNLDIKNKNGKTPLFYYKGKKNIRKDFKNLIKEKKDDLKYLKLKTPMHTPFIGYYWVTLTSVLYILEKYPNTGFPICKNFKNDLMEINKAYNINSIQKNIYTEFNENLFCLVSGRIFWRNKNDYYISQNLKNSLKNVISKDIIFIYLSIYYKYSSHAGIIIIDNSNLEIERFETYGISNNDIFIDQVLKKYFLNTLKELTNKEYIYNSPIDYQNYFDFQAISEEDLKYMNESFGFCVAWVFWYLEHKLLNPRIKSKKLIDKLKKKMLDDDKKILDNIRSYASKLDKFMIKKLLSYKIKKNYIYFLHNDNEKTKIIYKYILDELLKIQNIE